MQIRLKGRVIFFLIAGVLAKGPVIFLLLTCRVVAHEKTMEGIRGQMERLRIVKELKWRTHIGNARAGSPITKKLQDGMLRANLATGSQCCFLQRRELCTAKEKATMLRLSDALLHSESRSLRIEEGGREMSLFQN